MISSGSSNVLLSFDFILFEERSDALFQNIFLSLTNSFLDLVGLGFGLPQYIR